jgi:hypothetical protein
MRPGPRGHCQDVRCTILCCSVVLSCTHSFALHSGRPTSASVLQRRNQSHVQQSFASLVLRLFLMRSLVDGTKFSVDSSINAASRWPSRWSAVLAAGWDREICHGATLGQRARDAFAGRSRLLEHVAHAATEESAGARDSPAGTAEDGRAGHSRAGESSHRMPAAARHESSRRSGRPTRGRRRLRRNAQCRITSRRRSQWRAGQWVWGKWEWKRPAGECSAAKSVIPT